MKITLSRARLSYEVRLTSPEFNLITNAATNVPKLYAILSEKFSVQTSEIQVIASQTIGDFAIRLFLFNRLSLIEFKIDSYKGTFTELSGVKDLQTVLECLELVERGAAAMMPDAVVRETQVTVPCWLSVEGGLPAVRARMEELAPQRIGIAAGFAAADEVSFTVSGNLSSKEEGWFAHFDLAPSAFPNYGDLYFMLDVRYVKGGKYNALDTRKDHFRGLSEALLSQAGFEAPEEAT
jgi:hypothetical protein